MKKSKLPKCKNCKNICQKAICINCYNYKLFEPKEVNKTHHTLLITLPIPTYNHYAKAGKRKVKPAIEQALIDLAELEELNNC